MIYVDGYVLAVKRDRLEDYRRIATDAAAIWREYGALRTVEAVADDVPHGEVTSFPRAVQATDDEVVVFSWIEYPDKATRDACNEKIMADPRMNMQGCEDVINGKTLIFGGFTPLVDNG